MRHCGQLRTHKGIRVSSLFAPNVQQMVCDKFYSSKFCRSPAASIHSVLLTPKSVYHPQCKNSREFRPKSVSPEHGLLQRYTGGLAGLVERKHHEQNRKVRRRFIATRIATQLRPGRGQTHHSSGQFLTRRHRLHQRNHRLRSRRLHPIPQSQL